MVKIFEKLIVAELLSCFSRPVQSIDNVAISIDDNGIETTLEYPFSGVLVARDVNIPDVPSFYADNICLALFPISNKINSVLLANDIFQYTSLTFYQFLATFYNDGFLRGNYNSTIVKRDLITVNQQF